MPPLTESAAEKLTPEQATAMVRVLELQAGWEALLKDKAQKDYLVGLRDRQKAKVYRLADQIATKLKSEMVGRNVVGDLPSTVRELDVVIAWCDKLVTPPTPSARLPKALKNEVA
ncbi:MAG: hypothetical protein K8U57_00920 [Planctomycetes bacterium]|nr:hypothetical protein [Planctomycetota bacterium]